MSRSVESLIRALYGRIGSRLIHVMMACGVLIGMLSTLLTGIWTAAYLRIPLPKFLVVLGLGELGVIAGVVIGVLWSWPMIRRILAWSGEGRNAAAAPDTWNVLVRAPFVIVTRACLMMVAPLLAVAVFAISYVDLPAWTLAPLAVSWVAGTAAGWVVVTFGGEFFARPMLEDVAKFLPPDFEPSARAWRLETKAIAPLPVIAFVAALAGGAFANPGIDGGVRLAIALAVALGTVLVAAAVFLIVTRSVLGPLGELVRATRRVRTGDLTPVPLVTADDLGELTYEFNRMLEGLREREALREHNVELDTALQASLEDLRRRAEELRASRARVVAAADAERRRLERDLHDGAQQHLVLLGLKLGMARRTLARDPSAVDSTLDELQADLDRALSELRDLAHGIYPPLLENEGLGAALAEAVQRAAIPASVESDGAGRYPRELEAAVYFCCLEALQNASKHAGEGARATVTLAEGGGALEFAISDTGRGYDDASVNGAGGLQNMVDRIGALGGTLEIRSAPGQGTRVHGTVPVSR